MIPSSFAAFTAGAMMVCSSSPRSPSSPQCGLSPSTAILGLVTPKSRFRESFIRRNLVRIFSVVMLVGTSFRGICPVTTPILSCALIMNIVTSFTPKASFRYSVCPVNWKPAFTISLLFIGPVMRTSISPFLRSSTARSSEVIAHFADSTLGCPGST